MIKIKKFNELFDDEELKASHEIDYISGRFKKFNLDDNFKDESMMKFIAKLSNVHYPMFMAFDDANKQPNGILNLGKAEIFCDYDEVDKEWILVAKSDLHSVVFGIVIHSVNNYDIFLYLDTEGTEPDDEISNPGFEYYNIDYKRVLELIEGVYIPFLKEAGFNELIDYKSYIGKEIRN
jgi:hypothetical protein